MNLVVLAAGISSRMKRSLEIAGDLAVTVGEAALRTPKSMIGVGSGSRPFLDYLLYNAREAGYRDVMLVVGEDDGPMRTTYGASDRGNRFHGLSIGYAKQRIPEGRTKPLGTADALLCALDARPDWKGSLFTVCNSDNLYSHHALRLLLETPHEGALIDYDRAALEFDEERIRQFAILEKDREGYLTRIIEKPSSEELRAAADAGGRIGVSMNIFRFSYDRIAPVLRSVPVHPVRLEKELPPAVMALVKGNPHAMRAVPLSEFVPDLTSVHDVARVREYLEAEYAGFAW